MRSARDLGAVSRAVRANRPSSDSAGSKHPRVGSCPGRRCHRRRHEQDRGPRADREREQVREDERGQANAGECRRCSCSMTSRPGLDAPEAADQQHDAPQGAGAGASRDRIAGDQRTGGDRRCGHGAHWAQRSARSVATLRRGRPRDERLQHGEVGARRPAVGVRSNGETTSVLRYARRAPVAQWSTVLFGEPKSSGLSSRRPRVRFPPGAF